MSELRRAFTAAASVVLAGVVDAVEHFCAANLVPEPIRLQLGIAVGEVIGNVIKHGGLGDLVRIELQLSTLPHEVRIHFADNGVPAVVDVEAAVMPDDLAESGRGLALARAVLSELSYSRTESVNHWRLVSRRFG